MSHEILKIIYNLRAICDLQNFWNSLQTLELTTTIHLYLLVVFGLCNSIRVKQITKDALFGQNVPGM